MKKILAVDYDRIVGVGDIGSGTGDPLDRLGSILSGVIGFMTVVAIVYFIFRMIIAGYGWMSSGGESQKVQTAQTTMWQNALGLAIVLLTMVFVNLMGFLIGGVDLLNLEWLRGLF